MMIMREGERAERKKNRRIKKETKSRVKMFKKSITARNKLLQHIHNIMEWQCSRAADTQKSVYSFLNTLKCLFLCSSLFPCIFLRRAPHKHLYIYTYMYTYLYKLLDWRLILTFFLLGKKRRNKHTSNITNEKTILWGIFFPFCT